MKNLDLPPLTLVLANGEDGYMVATCPELDVVSQGKTPAEAEAMLREAVELFLEHATDREVTRRLSQRHMLIKPLELLHA